MFLDYKSKDITYIYQDTWTPVIGEQLVCMQNRISITIYTACLLLFGKDSFKTYCQKELFLYTQHTYNSFISYII